MLGQSPLALPHPHSLKGPIPSTVRRTPKKANDLVGARRERPQTMITSPGYALGGPPPPRRGYLDAASRYVRKAAGQYRRLVSQY